MYFNPISKEENAKELGGEMPSALAGDPHATLSPETGSREVLGWRLHEPCSQ